MKKKDFIKAIREMADELEKDSFKIIDLESGYIFANMNYGEVNVKVAEGVRVSVRLYDKNSEEA